MGRFLVYCCMRSPKALNYLSRVPKLRELVLENNEYALKDRVDACLWAMCLEGACVQERLHEILMNTAHTDHFKHSLELLKVVLNDQFLWMLKRRKASKVLGVVKEDLAALEVYFRSPLTVDKEEASVLKEQRENRRKTLQKVVKRGLGLLSVGGGNKAD